MDKMKMNNTYVSGIQIPKIYVKEGEIKPTEKDNGWIYQNGEVASKNDIGEYTNVWLPTNFRFMPDYDNLRYSFNKPIKVVFNQDNKTEMEMSDIISGYIYDDGSIDIYNYTGNIGKVCIDIYDNRTEYECKKRDIFDQFKNIKYYPNISKDSEEFQKMIHCVDNV